MSQPANHLPQMFTIAQIAERMSVSTKTISRLISAGELRTHRLGRQVRIAHDDAISFIAMRRH